MENRLIHISATKLALWFNRYVGKEGLEFQKLVLGIEILIINVSKFIIMYTLAALLGTLWQTAILHIAYIPIKRYSFGLHALNSTVCTIVSCSMFVLMPWLLRGAGISNIAVIAAFAPIIVCFYRYAPADTKYRPLVGAKLRKELKLKAVVCGIALMAIALLIPNPHIKLLLTLGAVYQCIAILPLTYKLLKRSERNYETYEK